MNVLGIEYRRAYTVAALREGEHRPRLIGDGRRTMIPNAVSGPAWGSTAVAHWDSTPKPGLWLGPTAADFWRGLHDRLVRFLGGAKPDEYGGECVIACTGTNELPAVCALARSIGFEKVSTISPPQAALARWVSQQAIAGAETRTVGVVTIGDATIEAAVAAVRLGSSQAILDIADAGVLPGTGTGTWTARLLHELSSQLSDPLPQNLRLELWQACLEYAEQLRRAASATLISWHGPLEEQLVSPLRMSADDVLDWPEMEVFTRWLSSALEEGMRCLGRNDPDLLLVSGVGAAWPLSSKDLRAFPRIVVSADPSVDIAMGAAAWPFLSREPMTSIPTAAIPDFTEDDPLPYPPAAPPSGVVIDTELSRLLDEEMGDWKG